MQLNDREIREALKQKLYNQAVKPRAIVEELRVHNGNAIADVVALYTEAHCFEIKGVNDKIERVLRQGGFYNTAFRKITVVTTKNHINKALEVVPSHWGIMVAFFEFGKVRLKHIRGASNNPYFDKKLALLTLWKSEMLGILNENKYRKNPREFLAQLISYNKKKVELSAHICEALVNRKIDSPMP